MSRQARGILAVFLLGAPTACSPTPDATKAVLERLKPGESATIGGVTFRMNRKQAGTADGDGWFPAHSDDGAFDIRSPVPYNDFTTSALASDGASVVTNTIGGRSAEGVKFMANCIRRSDGKVPPDWAAAVAASVTAEMERVEQSPVKVPGGSGFQIRVFSPSRGRFQALLIAGRRSMCQVTVEYRGAEQPAVESAARVFLSSFALTEADRQDEREGS